MLRTLIMQIFYCLHNFTFLPVFRGVEVFRSSIAERVKYLSLAGVVSEMGSGMFFSTAA